MARRGTKGSLLDVVLVLGLVGAFLLSGSAATYPTTGSPKWGIAGPAQWPAPDGTGHGSIAPLEVGVGPGHARSLSHDSHLAAAGPSRAHPYPSSMINPLQYVSKEPAPMGVADFGVSGKSPGATAYEYSTPVLQGRAVVRSMTVTISGSTSKVTAFELNAVLYLQRNGSNYSYWIQDGLHLDSSTDEYSIGGAYVWNFSSPTARLAPGELQGNSGSALASDTYYFIPGCGATFPGECTRLTLPVTLLGRIASATSGGIPYVDFEYNVGGGWVSYDNVTFNHMVGAADSGFRVTGFVPTPISPALYYDAEWDWVGAGGGSSSVDQASNISMSLDRWNGHNLQPVSTAWNFGSNTGESSSNVSDLLGSAVASEPAAHLASGAGSLGVLYNQSAVGFLNLSVPTLLPETVLVDGSSVPFYGGWANVTLLAGSHSLYLRGYSNASDQFQISPGTTTVVNLTGAGRVAFAETGLPAGTVWGVVVNGTRQTSSGSTVVVNLPNGTYSLSSVAVPGYYQAGSTLSTFSLPGPAAYTIAYSVFTYAVAFRESGLPGSTRWWVNASGTLVEGMGPTLQVSAPNGTTPFVVGSSYAFVATPSAGSIHVVRGVPLPVSVVFAYRPTFIVGSVIPTNASVTINGSAQPVIGGSFNDSVIPGSYLLVASASGYVTQSFEVTATAGNLSWANVTLAANSTAPTNPPSTVSTTQSLPLTTALAIVAVAGILAVGVIAVVLRRRKLG